MGHGDALLQPQCDVAELATYCWHDVIKNKIQAFLDPLLQEWLDDAANLGRLQAALQRLPAELGGFSPARAAAQLAPIRGMPEEARNRLLKRLDTMFQQEFKPEARRKRLQAAISPLQDALEEYRAARNRPGMAQRLARVRAAAARARKEIERLPAGFWIPAQVGRR